MDSYNVDDSYNNDDITNADHGSSGIDIPSSDNGQFTEVQVGESSSNDIISTNNPLGIANNVNDIPDSSYPPVEGQNVSVTLGGNDFQSQLRQIMKPHDNIHTGLASETETDYNETLSDIKSQTEVLNQDGHKTLTHSKADTGSQLSFGCTGCATKCLHTCSGACFTSCSGSCDGSSSGR